VVSLCMAASEICAKVGSDAGVRATMSQIFIFYFLLSFATWLVTVASRPVSSWHFSRSSFWQSFPEEGQVPNQWQFWLVALFDVEANFATLFAIQYTSLTSVLLLGTGGVLPCVLILGSLFLGHRYRLLHLAGVVLALIGYGCIVSSDFAGSEDARKPLAPLSGDLLCAVAAALFACSSLGQEFLLRSCAPATILRRMQPAAAVLSGCQLLLFHASELS
ncbi:unnamed protein product, partial [Polarella glacialis]